MAVSSTSELTEGRFLAHITTTSIQFVGLGLLLYYETAIKMLMAEGVPLHRSPLLRRLLHTEQRSMKSVS